MNKFVDSIFFYKGIDFLKNVFFCQGEKYSLAFGVVFAREWPYHAHFEIEARRNTQIFQEYNRAFVRRASLNTVKTLTNNFYLSLHFNLHKKIKSGALVTHGFTCFNFICFKIKMEFIIECF